MTMKHRWLALFELASETIACVLAGAVVAVCAIRTDQMLAPELRLETFELQFANAGTFEESAPNVLRGAALNYLIQMASALARAR